MTETFPRSRRFRRLASAPLHMAGLVVAVAGAMMLVAGIVEAIDGGPDTVALLLSGAAVGGIGAILWRLTHAPKTLPIRSVFSSVATAWVAISLAGAVPYLATGALRRLDDALFESISGFTTTGASVFPEVETLSHGLLLWRSSTQWLGGMGVIVLAVAVLPFLGAGGMALLRSEIPGGGSERLAPRMRTTARRLWTVYLGFTVATAIGYAAAGMGGFDAVNHAFTTVSTGGFSTRTASFAAFDSAAIEWIAVLAMFVAGTNFVLLWRATRGNLGPLLTSSEARAYGSIAVGASLLAVAWNTGLEIPGHDTIRESVFSVVSVVSTTGFSTADFGLWSHPGQALLLFLMLIGAMTGSTAGGSKIFRLLAAAGYARREILRHVHSQLVAVVRLGREVVPEEVLARILGYYAVFFTVLLAGTVAVAAFEIDIVTSVSTVAASLGNVGPGLGTVSPGGGFLSLDAGARGITMLLMLLGRLEIYPVLLGAAALLDTTRKFFPARVDRAIARRVG